MTHLDNTSPQPHEPKASRKAAFAAEYGDDDSQHMGTLWKLDLAQPLPAPVEPRRPATFTRIGPDAAQELSQAIEDADPARILRRFEAGQQCYIGRVDGALATYGWVTFNQEKIGELGLNIRLKSGEAYIWGCATLEAYRGLRLYPALLSYILDQLQQAGLRRAWIGADADNQPSQKGFILAGFQPIADIMLKPYPATQPYWVRAQPGASPQDVHDADYALFSGEIRGPHQGQPLLTAGEPLASAKAAMIMIHGRGASAEDILTLTRELDQPGFAYLAPQAANYTWYPNSFLAPIASNEPGITSGLTVISALFEQLASAGISAERTILTGFSQGACLSLEYAARNAQRYGGVACLSGALIGPPDSPRNYQGTLAGSTIFLGCSDVDFHIPRERVLESAQIMKRLGGSVTARLYPGMGHTVNRDELRFVQNIMAALV